MLNWFIGLPPGGVSLVWIFWWVFGAYNSPAVHPRVSQEERDYIEDRIGSNLKIQRKVVLEFMYVCMFVYVKVIILLSLLSL